MGYTFLEMCLFTFPNSQMTEFGMYTNKSGE